MDPYLLWDILQSEENLELAFKYALYDREKSEHFYNPIELHNAKKHKEDILDRIKSDLNNLSNYEPQTAYSYYPPKNKLVYRRMIYLPFKDLVIRYALIKVIAEELDKDLHERCFANRMETDKNKSDERLFVDFAEKSHPKFCLWQEECIDDKNYKILALTDISSFYDSISHGYLLKTMAKKLKVPENSRIIQLLKKHLKLKVISYSFEDGRPKDPKQLEHGITIGNQCDSFLANVYLMDLDEKINSIEEIEFGRYNDDMRIFGNELDPVLDAMRIIQEYLLERGLNLNTSKTELAADREKIEQLKSEILNVSGSNEPISYKAAYFSEQEVEKIEEIRDQHLNKLSKKFNDNTKIKNAKIAKEYCKYLNLQDEKGYNIITLSKRNIIHVNKLTEIMINYRSSSKHASWLLVQTAFHDKVNYGVSIHAKKQIQQLLDNEDVSLYGKYRMIHHIVKIKQKYNNGELWRFFDKLSNNEKSNLISLSKKLMNKPAFDLNIITIYLLALIADDYQDLENFVYKNMNNIGGPVKSVLNILKYKLPLEDLNDVRPINKTAYEKKKKKIQDFGRKIDFGQDFSEEINFGQDFGEEIDFGQDEVKQN